MTLKNVAQQTEIDERRQRVARLYVAGKRQAEIAKELDVSEATVSLDIKAMRDRWRREATADIATHTRRQYERLEQLWLALQKSIEAGSPRAIEVGVKLIERQAKLLGTDKPERHDVEATVKVEYVNDWRENPVADAPSGTASSPKPGAAVQLPGGGAPLEKDDTGHDDRS